MNKKADFPGILDFIWYLFLILLPLTSVPVVVRLVHSDVVAAPSALLLPILLVGILIPVIKEKKAFPENLIPLILFVIAALASTAISFFYQLPDYKGTNPFRASFSAVLTLFVGFSFYLVTLLYLKDEKRINTTFKLLNISGAVVLIWTLAQAVCWYKYQRYPEWMKNTQFTLSIGSLYRQRFVGFTLEPSWLAHQLNLLYLPLWFAASVTGHTVFRLRFKFITIERCLFAIGILVLFLTLSRVGLAAFLMTAAFAAAIFVHRLIQNASKKFPLKHKKLVTLSAYAGILLAAAAIAFGIVFLLTKLDFRMAGLFDIRAKGRSDPVFYIADKLSLAARFVYWDGGLSIFDRYPLFGVGLGHAGLYLPQLMNDYAFRLVEVRRLLFRSNTLLNIKSLWIRILAETGIVGFAFFFIWYLRSFFTNAIRLTHSNKMIRTAAWMGCFALIAFIFEGFSLDTFALPYIWFSAALAAAAGEIKS